MTKKDKIMDKKRKFVLIILVLTGIQTYFYGLPWPIQIQEAIEYNSCIDNKKNSPLKTPATWLCGQLDKCDHNFFISCEYNQN